MKLRIARKIARRPLWKVYTIDQLQRAERVLRRAWRRPHAPTGDPETTAGLDDFFGALRVEARRRWQAASSPCNCAAIMFAMGRFVGDMENGHHVDCVAQNALEVSK